MKIIKSNRVRQKSHMLTELVTPEQICLPVLSVLRLIAKPPYYKNVDDPFVSSVSSCENSF